MNDMFFMFLKVFALFLLWRIYRGKKQAKKEEKIVTELLGFIPKEKVKIESHSYSEDSIFGISWHASEEEWEKVLKKEKAYSLDTLIEMSDNEEFFNLLDIDEENTIEKKELLDKSIQFINEVKFSFQDCCIEESEIYFMYQSGVNWFIVLWKHNYNANYLDGDIYLTHYTI
jgi:hypothetical protein